MDASLLTARVGVALARRERDALLIGAAGQGVPRQGEVRRAVGCT